MSESENNVTKGKQRFLKIAIVISLAVAVGALLYAKNNPGSECPCATGSDKGSTIAPVTEPEPQAEVTSKVPTLIDLGATKCIPCKMMAPILEELKTEYAGTFDVVFIDVWENPDAAKKHNINLIPTQIFFNADGKELFRHEGFFAKEDILAKWKELGVDLAATPPAAPESPGAPAPPLEPSFSRWEPAVPDSRSKENVCYMCDGDVHPKTRTVMKTDKGDVNFCSTHCYFIMCSSMVPPKNTHDDASMTDWANGSLVPAAAASYVLGMDAANRPEIKAFADAVTATAEQQAHGGNILNMAALQKQEMATLCGFCDRAVYPVDACAVKVEGLNTWGCCTMCALGVAARLQKDIEVTAKDALTSEVIQVKTVGGNVSVLEPRTAVAWAGTKKDAEGKLVSTGCFKQAFFTNEDNLKQWVEAHPTATGRAISINQALAEKMKLTSEQISKACKIGECVPK
jgi:thioredoxin 1